MKKTQNRPLVILHGWSDSAEGFQPLKKSLQQKIGADIYEISLADYLSMDDEVRYDDIVTMMEEAWNKKRISRSPGSVDMIVHSTGALVAREWLRKHYSEEGKPPIKHLVMLAPANFGSPLAHKGRAFYGRVIKGFKSEKMFQTGTRILKGLELASPYTWNLGVFDRLTPAIDLYGSSKILCTVLVGNTGYSGIASAANEEGSDGTVRVSTANLNCAAIEIDFSKTPSRPEFQVRTSQGQTAFRVIDGENHSSIAGKGVFESTETLDLIIRALSVTDQNFASWCKECEERTGLTYDQTTHDNYKHGYQNTLVRVVDNFDVPVKDYFLEFFRDDADDIFDRFAGFFHRDVIGTVHAYSDDSSFRSFLVDCTTLFNSFPSYMNISLTAMPEFKSNGNVGYRTFTDDDIGCLRVEKETLRTLFQPNRTALITIKLKRERHPNIFKI